jgi:hypothetical protein
VGGGGARTAIKPIPTGQKLPGARGLLSLRLTQADPFALSYHMSGTSLGQPYPFGDEYPQAPFGACAKRSLHRCAHSLKWPLDNTLYIFDNNGF